MRAYATKLAANSRYDLTARVANAGAGLDLPAELADMDAQILRTRQFVPQAAREGRRSLAIVVSSARPPPRTARRKAKPRF
jgi:hypothetical protein